MATSAVPRHPSTAMIEDAIHSLGTVGGLAGCRHLVVCDGYGGADDDLAARYREYKQKLRALAASGRFSTAVEIIDRSSPVGLPGVILDGLARAHTPYVLVYEHDWRLVRRIDTRGILRTFTEHRDVKYVRLNKHENREMGSLYGSWDVVVKPDVRRRPVPLLRTGCWQCTPHFARTSYYLKVVRPHLSECPQGGAHGYEDRLNAHYVGDVMALGFDRAQRKWGVFIYGKTGDRAVVRHLNGSDRHSEPPDARTRRLVRQSFAPNWRQWHRPPRQVMG
jgi:hypothetical protein